MYRTLYHIVLIISFVSGLYMFYIKTGETLNKKELVGNLKLSFPTVLWFFGFCVWNLRSTLIKKIIIITASDAYRFVQTWNWRSTWIINLYLVERPLKIKQHPFLNFPMRRATPATLWECPIFYSAVNLGQESQCESSSNSTWFACTIKRVSKCEEGSRHDE